MKRKKGLIAIIAVIVMIALVFVGYNIYRYPATFRSLKDNSNVYMESNGEIRGNERPALTDTVKNMEEYPFWRFLEKGVKVSVNTDNRTVSHTTMTRERRLLADSFGFTDEELNIMEEYAREGRFLS